jgi:hypothetical protein
MVKMKRAFDPESAIAVREPPYRAFRYLLAAFLTTQLGPVAKPA